MISIRVGVITNRFTELARRAPSVAVDAIREAIDETAKQAYNRAPYRTGILRGSIHARMINQFAGEVEVGAPYAPFVEYGTRFMPAQPFLTPAAEAVRPRYLAAVAQAVKEQMA